ncbi:MAG: 4-hydroxy-tetrahydrodipicolinate synthase [Acidobacteria bacterium]|nr:4-hydroxy-tetrahydrodipicolinate synthase [Acidobacteriota bacterium]
MNTFSGTYVALATPFDVDGGLDLGGMVKLLQHVAPHVDHLVVLGSTGEAATVTEPEREILIKTCLREAQGRPVWVGTGHNATAQAIAWTQHAQRLGAAGALVVTPYYNKPTPEGLFLHYQAIARAVPGFPLIVYNVPGRTGLNITPATMNRLWQIPEVVALKESSGNLVQIAEIARSLPENKVLLAGDDVHALASIALGAQGLVSVMANLVPEKTQHLVDSARSGLLPQALAIHRELAPLMDALFVETNPIPLKAGLALMGLAQDHVRLPLTVASPATRKLLQSVLATVQVQTQASTQV